MTHLRRLGAIADAILTHDRPIVRPVDDSVARVGPDGLQLLRRARGYAPLPIDFAPESPTILAVGGHLKNAIALALANGGSRDGQGRPESNTAQAVLGSHVGDLDNLLSVEVHRQAIRDLTSFFEVVPDLVACDLHPDYASTRHAETLAAEWDVPLVRVQHHHAHVAACMAEHQLEGPVLGLAWDGTGYGADGTVWGGEALACEGRSISPGSPICARSPCPAAIERPASRGDRLWECCSSCLGPRPAKSWPTHQASLHLAGFSRRSWKRCWRCWPEASTARGPAAWDGCSTRWPRCAGCRR